MDYLAQLASVVTIIGFVYAFFRNFKADLEKRFDHVDHYNEVLRNDIKEIRTGLNRLEGAFYNKDCCMFKDEKKKKKAE
jgi:hypothetical protein